MEYRIAFGWRVFMYLVAPLMCALGVWLLFEFFFTYKINNEGLALEALLFLIPLCLIVGSLYSMVRIHREKITIKDNTLVHQLAFSTKKLAFDTILGFRIDQNYFHIIPNQESLKTLRINSYIEEKDSFLDFLFKNFESLNLKNKAKEVAEILSNKDFGKDESERGALFSLAKKTTTWLSAISLLACLWAWFYPRPYSLAILTNITLPFISIIVLILFKGLIKIDSHHNSTYPSILSTLMLPAAAVGIRCLFDYNFLNLSNIWTFSIVSSMCLFILLWCSSNELNKTTPSSIFSSLIIFLILFGHLFSSTFLLNVMFDSSSVSAYKAEVFSKHSSKNFYSVKLSEGWGRNINKKIKANISTKFFNKVQKGDSVLVTVREGAFGGSWFIVEEITFSTNTNSIENFEFKEDSSLFKLNKL